MVVSLLPQYPAEYMMIKIDDDDDDDDDDPHHKQEWLHTQHICI